MVTVIILVGLLLGVALCALIWAMIKPEKPISGLLPDKNDRP